MTGRCHALLGSKLCLLSLFAMGTALMAQERVVRVGYNEFAPFIVEADAARPQGFSIELWHAVAAEVGVATEWVPYDSVSEKLNQLQAGAIDVAIGGITITSERERIIDFTHPCHRTGLDILVKAEKGSSLWRGISSLFTPGKLFILGGFLLLIVISGHLIWLAERGKEAFNDNYFPGVFEGMYWAIVTASTVGYGDKAPAKWAGRLLAGLVIIISLPMFALFTAEIASTFTLQEIRSNISGPEDLGRMNTGVVAGTTSAQFVASIGGRFKEYTKDSDAYAALEAGEVDAVVYEAPNLQYYAMKRNDESLLVVGKLFQPQVLAFATQSGSPLREELNLALLSLEETGELGRIKSSWFETQ